MRKAAVFLGMLIVFGVLWLIGGQFRSRLTGAGDATKESRTSQPEQSAAAPEGALALRDVSRRGAKTGAGVARRDEGGRTAASLAAHALSPNSCEERCGVDCVEDADGGLVCPPTCDTQQDCKEGEACTDIPLVGGGSVSRCLRSNCELGSSPGSCGKGRTCVLQLLLNGQLQRCAPTGLRKAGEACVKTRPGVTTNPLTSLCGRDLTCSNGFCVPAVCESPSDCPTGSICLAHKGARVCEWMCDESIPCPQGFECREHDQMPIRVCMPSSTPRSCLNDGCPEGSSCFVYNASSVLPLARCLKTCDPEVGTGCGEDAVCFDPGNGGHCFASCRTNESQCERDEMCYEPKGGPGPICILDQNKLLTEFFAEISARAGGD